jgi:hypothetical protein
MALVPVSCTHKGTVICNSWLQQAEAPARARHVSGPHSSWTPGVFCTYFYNHARRLRLEKLEVPTGF